MVFAKRLLLCVSVLCVYSFAKKFFCSLYVIWSFLLYIIQESELNTILPSFWLCILYYVRCTIYMLCLLCMRRLCLSMGILNFSQSFSFVEARTKAHSNQNGKAMENKRRKLADNKSVWRVYKINILFLFSSVAYSSNAVLFFFQHFFQLYNAHRP